VVLSIEDKLNYLEQPIPHVPVAPAGQQVAPEILAAHSAWVKGLKEIAGVMLMTMEPEIQRNLEPLHVHEMLKELKTLFAQQAEQELLQTTRDFHSCRQKEGQLVSLYVLKIKGYINNLERLGHPVTLGLGVSLILISLRKEYDGFVQNYNMHNMGKTVNELHAMLKLHEQTLPKSNAPALNAIRAGKVQKGNKHKKSHFQTATKGHNHGKGKNKQAYALKPKIPAPPKRKNTAKDSICHECRKIGHWKRNCPQSTRTRHAPDRMCLYIDAEEHELGDLGEPANYKAALLDPESKKWLNAINVEIQSIKDNEHKHEVFETFKVFQKEVENQLGKTIKSLRSDRRGKHMSQAFFDHLNDHGIIAHRTPPYTPQHNAVSERRNRTLLDMVQSMMSQTTLPKSFWDYALKIDARILIWFQLR
nr:zinc finger, CCHC-type [Tanacetum cinerariifolium]